VPAAGRASQIFSFTSAICATAAANSACRPTSARTFPTFREPGLPAARLDGPARLLSDHRRNPVTERTILCNQLRWHLHELDPGLLVPPAACAATASWTTWKPSLSWRRRRRQQDPAHWLRDHRRPAQLRTDGYSASPTGGTAQ